MKSVIDSILNTVIVLLRSALAVFEGLAATKIVADGFDIKVIDPKSLAKMKKTEIEAYAKDEFSVDLDRRKTKAGMIEELVSKVDISK